MFIPKKDEDKVEPAAYSEKDYAQLFHEASQMATAELDKPFDQLQKEDQAINDKKKQKSDEELTLQLQENTDTPLAKMDDNNNQNTCNDPDPESLPEIDMVEAMNYTDLAANSTAQTFEKRELLYAKSSNSTEEAPKPPPPAQKSFFEQILDKEVEKNPEAIKTLAEPASA